MQKYKRGEIQFLVKICEKRAWSILNIKWVGDLLITLGLNASLYLTGNMGNLRIFLFSAKKLENYSNNGVRYKSPAIMD